jgi:hypothetical protein
MANCRFYRIAPSARKFDFGGVWLRARGQGLAAFGRFAHPGDLSNGDVLRRKCTLYSRHTSSPLEAAEAGAQTVGHSPQGCRPFWVSPASQL